MRIAYKIDDRIGQFYLLAALAYHATISGRPQVAARLLGASEAIRIGAGATVMAVLAPFIVQAEESASAALGGSKYAAELEIGRHLSREAAVRVALGEGHDVAAAFDHSDTGILGKRQAEVARLVADGLSNKQIGARLFISERTVDSHVRSILDKLGVNTRAQIAGWVESLNR